MIVAVSFTLKIPYFIAYLYQKLVTFFSFNSRVGVLFEFLCQFFYFLDGRELQLTLKLMGCVLFSVIHFPVNDLRVCLIK